MKKKKPSQDLPTQHSFFDLPIDPRPAPIIASEKWNFPLQYHLASDGKTYFAVQDWIVGLVGCDNIAAGKMWRQFKKSDSYLNSESENKSSISNVTLPYLASDGKTYQRDYIDDRLAYLLSQYLRASESRPMLDEIRQFLASSGSTMDEFRRDPEKMLSVAQSRMQKDIERHDKAGLGNRPEILLLKSKYDASLLLGELKSTISAVLTLTGKEWGEFHSAEYQMLLGLTATQIKQARNAKSVRDSLNVFEYNALIHAERDLMALISIQKNLDSYRLISQVKMVYEPIGKNLQGLLDNIGYSTLTGKPLLQSTNQ